MGEQGATFLVILGRTDLRDCDCISQACILQILFSLYLLIVI